VKAKQPISSYKKAVRGEFINHAAIGASRGQQATKGASRRKLKAVPVLVIYCVPESLLVACCIQDGSTNLVR